MGLRSEAHAAARPCLIEANAPSSCYTRTTRVNCRPLISSADASAGQMKPMIEDRKACARSIMPLGWAHALASIFTPAISIARLAVD